MKKIDTNKLYVACRVYDAQRELEPWVQYESFGVLEHKIYVCPKRVLLVQERVNCQDVYIDFNTRRIVTPRNYESSYEGESSCFQSLYLSGYPMGPLTWERRAYFDGKAREVQFVMPFEEYVKDRLGMELYSEISLSTAKSLLRLINMREGRTFMLSFDPETAQKQLTDRVFHGYMPEKIKTLK